MTKKNQWLYAIKQTRNQYKLENHPTAIEHTMCKVADNGNCNKCIFKAFKANSIIQPYCCSRECLPYSTDPNTPFPPEPGERVKILYFFKLLYEIVKDIHGSHFITLNDPLMDSRILAADREAAR